MRESGILMPVSSLPGPYGIGCFGAEALKFVDFLAAAGQHIWQLLPLSPTGYGDSPYQSCSAFAGNPYFVDLEALEKEGLLTAADLKAESGGKNPLEVDYGTLYVSRFAVLRKAYAAWRSRCAGLHGCSYYYPDDYYAFTLANEDWLEDYALYMALKVANKMKNWVEWDAPYRRRDKAVLAAFAAANEEEIGFWKFVQYKFSAQWQAVKTYANEKGVQILGDIPIYVSADSVDAWVGGKLFELDADGRFARVAGCPPDYFSADGQLWGNPLYDWAYHKKTGYAWWIQRVRHALGIYDLLRIDHFRGFDTYWAIPADSATAKTGKWENGPGMELFDALEQALGKLQVTETKTGSINPGNPTDGVSMVNLSDEEDTLFTMEFYQTGILAYRSPDHQTFYVCDPQSLNSFYQTVEQLCTQVSSTPASLAWMDYGALDSMVVTSNAGKSKKEVGLIRDHAQTLFGFLQQLHVSKDSVREEKKMFNKPEYHMDIEFSGGMVMQVDLSKGSLLVDGGDGVILHYTLIGDRNLELVRAELERRSTD